MLESLLISKKTLSKTLKECHMTILDGCLGYTKIDAIQSVEFFS